MPGEPGGPARPSGPGKPISNIIENICQYLIPRK
jgi:hypothetical protein